MKIIRRVIGPFAGAWGFGADLSMKYKINKRCLYSILFAVSAMIYYISAIQLFSFVLRQRKYFPQVMTLQAIAGTCLGQSTSQWQQRCYSDRCRPAPCDIGHCTSGSKALDLNSLSYRKY